MAKVLSHLSSFPRNRPFHASPALMEYTCREYHSKKHFSWKQNKLKPTVLLQLFDLINYFLQNRVWLGLNHLFSTPQWQCTLTAVLRGGVRKLFKLFTYTLYMAAKAGGGRIFILNILGKKAASVCSFQLIRNMRSWRLLMSSEFLALL